jgi:hypothetical protein
MAYSLAKLKSNGVEESPSLDYFLLESCQKIFTIRTIL